MKKIYIGIFLALFILIYGSLNYYIGYHGWQAFGGIVSSGIYWPVFWFLAFSYLLGRLMRKVLPARINYFLELIGSYWLGIFFYAFLITAVIDLIVLLDHWFGFLPPFLKNPVNLGMGSILVIACLLIYGTWNARHPGVARYRIKIPKKAGALRSLHIVAVSDIHLGAVMHNGRLLHMVDMVNRENPDLVLLPGDILDENVEPFVEQEMALSFRQLNPRFGVYAVFGNHEFIGGNHNEAEKYLQEAGITVLRDRCQKVADSIYIAGRDDQGGKRFSGKARIGLEQLLAGIDQMLPVILLDHQPVELADAAQMGVDLQLSGHTHAGQLFPVNLITGRIFEVDWGYLRRGTLNVLVSSGFGTWGPPIRLGNRPEIMDIQLDFD